MKFKEKIELKKALREFLGEDGFFATHGDGYCYESSNREISGSMAWEISLEDAIKMGIPHYIMDKIKLH